MQLVSQQFEAADLTAAIELCYERNWTDGAPVVPPTAEAVERMIAYLGRDPGKVIGVIPPRDGLATIETIAINSVMAGCKPEHVPIVIAAVKAMLQERFNLNGVQTTTHSCAPLTMVSGPAVKRLGFNTREGAFGHGCRASFAVGRAVRLVLWNIGGGYPCDPCKTTQGHPGYYSFCIADDADSNPWEPLHVDHGYQPEDTAVIVTAVEGPHLVAPAAGYCPVEDVFFILADAVARIGSPSVGGGDMVLVLSPMAAKALADAGYSKSAVKQELMRLATRPVRDVKRRHISAPETHPMHWKNFTDPTNDDAPVPYIRSMENLEILVAGGWGSGGAFSSLCPGWGLHGGFTVSQKVEFPRANS